MRWLTKTSPGANSGMPGRRYPSRRNLWLGRRVCRAMRTPMLALLVAAPRGRRGAARRHRRAPSGWTPTHDASPSARATSPCRARRSPRDGTSVLAFRSKSGKLMLSTGARERPLHARRAPIDAAGVRDWSVAARAGGGFIVAWEDTRRHPRARTRTRAGRADDRRRVVASNGEEINGVQVAADPRGGWVARRAPVPPDEGPLLLRARDDARAPAGGSPAPSRTSAPASSASTRARRWRSPSTTPAARCSRSCREAPFSPTTQPTAVVSTRPHGGRSARPVALPGDPAGDPRVAVGAAAAR